MHFQGRATQKHAGKSSIELSREAIRFAVLIPVEQPRLMKGQGEILLGTLSTEYRGEFTLPGTALLPLAIA